jgi:hypothetical protein
LLERNVEFNEWESKLLKEEDKSSVVETYFSVQSPLLRLQIVCLICAHVWEDGTVDEDVGYKGKNQCVS